MKSYTLLMFFSLVVVGVVASLAATTSQSTGSKLDGKFVLVEQNGMGYGVHENARFESVGQNDFIVLPMQHTGTTITYDYWIPLKDVRLLRVFHSKKDAADYVEKRDSRLQSPVASEAKKD